MQLSALLNEEPAAMAQVTEAQFPGKVDFTATNGHTPRLPSLEQYFGNFHLNNRPSTSSASSAGSCYTSSSQSTPYGSPSPATSPIKVESAVSHLSLNRRPNQAPKDKEASRSRPIRQSRKEKRKERKARIEAEKRTSGVVRTSKVAKADREFEAREKLTRHIGSQSAALRKINPDIIMEAAVNDGQGWKSLKSNNIVDDDDIPKDHILRHNKEHVIDTGTLFVEHTQGLDEVFLYLTQYNLVGQDHISQCLEQCMKTKATRYFDHAFRTLLTIVSQLPGPMSSKARL